MGLRARLVHLPVVSRHLVEDHHRLLHEISVTDAKHLRAMHPGQRVLVAGVRASAQTPPIASGKRLAFVSLEDGSGLVYLAFFEDSDERCAHTIFHHGLLPVRGTVEARGPRRTVAGEMARDLDEDGLPPEPPTGRKPSSTSWARPRHPPPPPAHAGPSQTIPVGTAGALMHSWSDRTGSLIVGGPCTGTNRWSFPPSPAPSRGLDLPVPTSSPVATAASADDELNRDRLGKKSGPLRRFQRPDRKQPDTRPATVKGGRRQTR